MPTPKTIIVTGANRGIGRAIATQLLSHPSLSQPSTPITLFATSRCGVDLALPPPSSASSTTIRYSALDISDRQSVRDFSQRVRDEAPNGRVDVLVNNAGVNLDFEDGGGTAANASANARKTVEVNFRGTMQMCDTFLPLLTPSTARIVNLSSVASTLMSPYPPAIQSRLRDPQLTLSDLDRLAHEFQAATRTNEPSTSGFSPPFRAYNFSKTCINALTRILARDNPSITVNACCPGWVRTDMGNLVGSARSQPPKTAEEGASIPVRLAVGDIGEVSGKYWANSSVRSRDEGHVQEW